MTDQMDLFQRRRFLREAPPSRPKHKKPLGQVAPRVIISLNGLLTITQGWIYPPHLVVHPVEDWMLTAWALSHSGIGKTFLTLPNSDRVLLRSIALLWQPLDWQPVWSNRADCWVVRRRTALQAQDILREIGLIQMDL